MNIDEALAKIMSDNKIDRLDIGFRNLSCTSNPYIATAWVDGIGQSQCSMGRGKTAGDAIADVLEKIRAYRAAQAVPSIELEVAA